MLLVPAMTSMNSCLLFTDPDDFIVDSPYNQLTYTPFTSDQDLCVQVLIVDDDVLEPVEYFGISLSSDDSCIEFKQQTNQIAILDNDCTLSRREKFVPKQCMLYCSYLRQLCIVN